MTELQKIAKLVEIQSLYNREKEIRNLYREEESKMEKIEHDNNILNQTKTDIEVNYSEMNKKINEEMGKRDEINRRIASLDEGKDKIKIARQLKSWEKEMERMQQELSLIQAQIDYDTGKQVEMKNELDRIVARIQENDGKVSELQSHINSIKEEYKGELADIQKRSEELSKEFEIQFYDYFQRMLDKTRGEAIVEVEHDTCSGCNIVLPTQLQGDLGPELPTENILMYQCPHCFRYLYYNEWLEAETA